MVRHDVISCKLQGGPRTEYLLSDHLYCTTHEFHVPSSLKTFNDYKAHANRANKPVKCIKVSNADNLSLSGNLVLNNWTGYETLMTSSKPRVPDLDDEEESSITRHLISTVTIVVIIVIDLRFTQIKNLVT